MQPRLLLLLLSLVVAMVVALIRPLPGRAAAAKPAHVQKKTSSRHLANAIPLGVRVAKYAKKFLGVPYVYGGTSPRYGFDCSGFVRYVYEHFGVDLAHSSYAQYGLGRRIGRWAMKPGDLVFFDGAGHVGIYIGNGRFIHAPHSGTHVQVSSLGGWYSHLFDGARRIRNA